MAFTKCWKIHFRLLLTSNRSFESLAVARFSLSSEAYVIATRYFSWDAIILGKKGNTMAAQWKAKLFLPEVMFAL